METTSEIRLRLRFEKEVNENLETVQQKFEKYKSIPSDDYFIKVRPEHIFLQFKKIRREYWSPNLHLHLEPSENNRTHIRGLFGPDQTLWTLFMFLHFIIAGVFIIFSMIAYSNYSLKLPYIMDLIVMFIMIIMWFLLYVIARQIREKGNDQMHELEKVFLDILES